MKCKANYCTGSHQILPASMTRRCWIGTAWCLLQEKYVFIHMVDKLSVACITNKTFQPNKIGPDDMQRRLAVHMRLHEFDQQISAMREGMAKVIPVPFLSLFTGPELETMVCGSQEISVSLLKSVTTYKGIEPTAPLCRWFWEVMESFNLAERSLFLRFVWGRTRLPRSATDFRGRDFVLQVSQHWVSL